MFDNETATCNLLIPHHENIFCSLFIQYLQTYEMLAVTNIIIIIKLNERSKSTYPFTS
jgi:hypothetical protein